MQTGYVDNLDVAPQQTKEVTLGYDYSQVCGCKEWMLNVYFKLKKAETLLPAGYTYRVPVHAFLQ